MVCSKTVNKVVSKLARKFSLSENIAKCMAKKFKNDVFGQLDHTNR